MPYIYDEKKIDKIIDDAVTYIDNGGHINSGLATYAQRCQNIYEIIQSGYVLTMGAFADWDVHNKDCSLKNFFVYLHKPSFNQKRRMKRIWKKANNIYMKGKNKKDKKFLEGIL